jgi:hypothetical protein
MVSPRRVFKPIRLQTRRAYFSGTVYPSINKEFSRVFPDFPYLLIIAIGVGDHLGDLRVVL